ncbi:hypothetical protein [Curtobacterium sp. MCBD17_040]|uniref:hypothetical protein n=1 Tax=Curtobacterium sp. MCBD17_040 TaxID=2175674 RepID=UPI000DA87CED|nr:hypothetical protein [Curtobacterium sp. MCBD17_040]WIB65523.1 hypothetical protein DEI94_19305 [Curtobacterium sp. MCBD17_040]
MRLREIDGFGWLRVVAVAVIMAAGWLLISTEIPHLPEFVRAGVAVAVAVAIALLMILTWRRQGGYTRTESLRHWVRGGSEPKGVTPRARVRYLAGVVGRGVSYAYLQLGVGGIWLVVSAFDVVNHGDLPRLSLHLLTGVIWAAAGANALRIRKWLPRAQRLLDESRRQEYLEIEARPA